MTNFPDWLVAELEKRSMSPAELARSSQKASAVISRILNGERSPAPETLEAIARALKLPPEEVFRAAGLLPPVIENPMLERANFLLNQLPAEDQEEFLEMMENRVERRKKQSQNSQRPLEHPGRA